ncbi:MAG: peroxiredoxin-like family protein [Lutibacter sp.]|uniref:peroxiredoxin-like family protein n=1 Tax=Lutibacter sp. TaxID=1925666 RepID=UPI00385CBA9C
MKITLLSLLLVFTINIASSQVNNKHLNIGDIAPQIIGVDQFNTKIDSEILLNNKKIMLVFYRGNWCPHCKKHLISLQKNLDKFVKKGIYVIVVTPERADKIKETIEKFNSTFSIIHDVDNIIMNNYKVAFDVNKNNVINYFEFTLKKVREYNETENDVLPVPATYLIDKDRKISYVHYNADYSKRSNFKEILANLN